MAEILSVISTISYIAAGVFAAVAVVLWFAFKIHFVIGDLSGRNAKKSIERMRTHNEETGRKTHQGKGRASHRKVYETGILDENKAKKSEWQATALLDDTGATALLNDAEATGALEEGNTTGTLDGFGRQNMQYKEPLIELTMIEEIMIIHTEEVI